jgi:hypothetical protein
MFVHPKEIERVSMLSPKERYIYFLKRVADSEEFYSLKNNENEFIISELEGNLLFPMWSAKEFAKNCLVDGWENHKIISLNLDDLEEEIFDLIAKEKYLLNIFPVKEKTGFIVDLDEFARDLSNELKNYQ